MTYTLLISLFQKLKRKKHKQTKLKMRKKKKTRKVKRIIGDYYLNADKSENKVQ